MSLRSRRQTPDARRQKGQANTPPNDYREETTMRNYRDLQVWQKAHQLTLTLYKATRKFPPEERFGLTSQIRRASAGIGAQLAEGCGRFGRAEFGRYAQIALAPPANSTTISCSPVTSAT
jgi:hypothetical protein